MTIRSCSREKEIKQLLANGHWPQAAPPELRAHIADCRSCKEQVLLTTAFQAARAESASAARPISPSAIWWRAQLRRRNAAVQRVSRPIIGAHIFALAVNLAVAIVLLASQANHGLRWLSWFQPNADQAGLPSLQALNPTALFTSTAAPHIFIPMLALVAVVSGLVVYFATDRQ